MKYILNSNSRATCGRAGNAGTGMRLLSRIGIAAAAIVAGLVTGCQKDPSDTDIAGIERAIVFEFEAPDFASATGEAAGTRAIPYMEKFPNGAIIHIIGTFHFSDDHTTSAYGTYKYDAASYRWSPVEPHPTLVWPEHATTADFVAFYLPGSTGEGNVAKLDVSADTPSVESEVFALSPPYDAEENAIYHTDPLRADIKAVNYGASVRMNFKHVCSRLILTDLGDLETDECWMEYKTGADKTEDKLNNGYKFVLNYEPVGQNYTGKIEFAPYFSMQSEKGFRYVRTRRETDVLETTGTAESPKVNVLCFYLAPGPYYGSQVYYRDEKPFLTLDVDKLGTSAETGLRSGYSYTLNIRTTDGVRNIEEVTPEEEWNDTEKAQKPKDIVEFLNALAQGETYSCDVVLDDGSTAQADLITKVDGGVRVNYNIDFEYQDIYEKFAEAGSSFGDVGGTDSKQGCVLSSTVTLYGNHKTFSHMKSPLFNEIAGAVVDLRIDSAEVQIPEKYLLFEEGVAGIPACRNTGILASKMTGRIENVLLSDCKVTAEIPDMSAQHGDGNHTHEDNTFGVGAVVGSVVGGIINNVRVSGTTTVNVQNKSGVEQSLKDNHVYVGGVIGNIAGGSVSNISTSGESPKINVTVSLVSRGASDLSTGGVIGYCATSVSDISLMSCETIVDASKSSCGEIYTGGIIGWGRWANKDTRQILQNANVRGSVHGGQATSTRKVLTEAEYAVSHSATGGIAGCVISYSMLNCRFNGEVNAGQRKGEFSRFVIVSTGGGIGMIKDAPASEDITVNSASHIFECTVRANVRGETFDTDLNFTGSFVGQQNIAAKEYKLAPYYTDDGDGNYYACPPTVATSVINCSSDGLPAQKDMSNETMTANLTYGNQNTQANTLPFCGVLFDDPKEYVTEL